MAKQKVLIVEDNELNIKLYMLCIKQLDIEVSIARDGEEALEKIYSVRPDLIVMDIQIPKIDGLTITKKIKADPEVKDIPVIAVTAFVMDGDKEKILQAGCDYYMSKPISTKEFPKLLEKYLKKSD